jgi:hypothetical protein
VSQSLLHEGKGLRLQIGYIIAGHHRSDVANHELDIYAEVYLPPLGEHLYATNMFNIQNLYPIRE